MDPIPNEAQRPLAPSLLQALGNRQRQLARDEGTSQVQERALVRDQVLQPDLGEGVQDHRRRGEITVSGILEIDALATEEELVRKHLQATIEDGLSAYEELGHDSVGRQRVEGPIGSSRPLD